MCEVSSARRAVHNSTMPVAVQWCPFFTKNLPQTSCVGSRRIRNLYDSFKLVEKSSATLLKKTRKINDTNKKLEPH